MTISRKTVITLVVAGPLLGLAGAWFYPMYRHQARSFQVTQIILAAVPLRDEIAARAAARNSLSGVGRGLTVKPAGNVTGGEASDDGLIKVRGLVDRHPVEVGMRPTLREGGRVLWRCRGLRGVEGWFIPESAYFPRECPLASAADPL